jgi:hypothetical protein
MNIYVGNISRTANEQDLKDAFAAFGQVSSASIIKDKFSGESRGFGFVEMPNKKTLFATKGGGPGRGVRPFLFLGGGSCIFPLKTVIMGS